MKYQITAFYFDDEDIVRHVSLGRYEADSPDSAMDQCRDEVEGNLADADVATDDPGRLRVRHSTPEIRQRFIETLNKQSTVFEVVPVRAVMRFVWPAPKVNPFARSSRRRKHAQARLN